MKYNSIRFEKNVISGGARVTPSICPRKSPRMSATMTKNKRKKRTTKSSP